MPNGDSFDDACQLALENPDLSVGVHISLVGEKALLPYSKTNNFISEDNMLPSSYTEFMKDLLLNKFPLSQIKDEIFAQVQKVIDAGIKPTHIDSHQHLHAYPKLFEIFTQAAKEFDIKTIRIPFEQNGVNMSRYSFRGLQLFILKTLASKARVIAKKSGLNYADHFWGIGMSGNINEDNLLETIKILKIGVNEIMCHPGISDKVLRKKYQWGYSWDDELNALQSENVKAALKCYNIILSNFNEAFIHL